MFESHHIHTAAPENKLALVRVDHRAVLAHHTATALDYKVETTQWRRGDTKTTDAVCEGIERERERGARVACDIRCSVDVSNDGSKCGARRKSGKLALLKGDEALLAKFAGVLEYGCFEVRGLRYPRPRPVRATKRRMMCLFLLSSKMQNRRGTNARKRSLLDEKHVHS